MTGGTDGRGARRPRREAERVVVERFASSLASAFPDGGREVVGLDAVLVVDGGARAVSARGRDAVIARLRELMTPETSVALASVNGAYGVALSRGGNVVGVITGEVRSARLSTIWVVCAPEKLRHWNAD